MWHSRKPESYACTGFRKQRHRQESLGRPLLSGHYHNIHGPALGLHSQRNTTGRTHRSQSTSIGKHSVGPKLHCWLRCYSVAVAPLHHPSLGNWTSRSTMPLQFQSASLHIHTTFIMLEQVHMDVFGTPGVWCRHLLLRSPQPTHELSTQPAGITSPLLIATADKTPISALF